MLINSSYHFAQRNNDNYIIGAWIRGGEFAPDVHGFVTFQGVSDGTQVSATIYGLPDYQPAHNSNAPIGPFGFHIHEHGNCDSSSTNATFESAGGHWNPTNQPHGNHAGDFPVLFSNHGFSQMTFFTDQFQPEDVLGKAVIIHQNPDDYRTQPSGDSGKRLACGVIEYLKVTQ